MNLVLLYLLTETVPENSLVSFLYIKSFFVLFCFLLSRILKHMWIRLVKLQKNLSTFTMIPWIKGEGYVTIIGGFTFSYLLLSLFGDIHVYGKDFLC